MANRFGDFNTELDNVAIYRALVEQHGESAARELFDLLNPRFTDNAPDHRFPGRLVGNGAGCSGVAKFEERNCLRCAARRLPVP